MSALDSFNFRATAARGRSRHTVRRIPSAARLLLVLLSVVLAVMAGPARAESVATVIPPDGLNLRAGPGAEHPVLELAPGGARVAITGPATDNGWYPAVYRGRRGWLSGAYLAFDDAATAATRRATVAPADGLNLRSAPLESASVQTVLAAGAVVTVTGRVTGDGWALVTAAERTGWVSAAYLTFDDQTPVAPPPAPAAAAFSAPSGGMATVRYYSRAFEGSRLACGGVFHADDLTVAATNSWPCGTILRLCKGASCVTVTVRDRGGMAANEIDLSPAGFSRLTSLEAGQISATVEVLGKE